MSVVEILPADHVVVFARTFDADAQPDTDVAEFGPTYLGRAIYENVGMIEDHVDLPEWRYLELFYFQSLVPPVASARLMEMAEGTTLLRAEIMVPTPGGYTLCVDWSEAYRRDSQALIEYIEVEPRHLDTYRSAMVNHCGPGGALLVEAGTARSFRALETRAVLYVKPGFPLNWNQIHAHDASSENFEKTLEAFDRAIQDASPIGVTFQDVFDMLAKIRKRHRWTIATCHADEFSASAEERYGASRARRRNG